MTTKKKKKTKAQTPSKKVRIAALAKVFEALGAKTPEKWAKAQIDDGSDELGRFVLLRALWLRTVEPGRLLANARRDKAAAEAIERVMKKVDLADLDALVRFAQKTALDDVCRVLDDPANNEDGIRWTIYRVDAAGMPLWPLAALRKDLVETEPS
jgi:hypothetical protein